MAVVTQFQTLVKQRPFCTERQKLRSPYSVWWAAVYNAYIHQGSMVSVSWVRGHQGNKGNEAADKAAKSAHNGIVWEFDASKHNDMPCHAYFNNTTVEDDLRQLLKLQSVARNHQTWIRQNRTQKNIRDWTQVEWRSSLAIIHDRNAPKGLFTSMADCHNRAHRVKKLHGMLPTLTYMKHWKPDLYAEDTCRRCLEEPEDTNHIWRCPATMDDQKKKWQETLEGMNDIGHRVWTQARKAWEREKKQWEDNQSKHPAEARRPFLRIEPSFSKARVDHMWDVMETTFSGATVIRDKATQGDMTDDNDLHDIEVDVAAEWTVQDLYHGLTPKALTAKWKKLCRTSTKIATYMAYRFISKIEEIGKKKIWLERCKITIEWEKEQGITSVRKRSKAQNAEGGRRRLDLMERLGGVKFTTMGERPG
ncbi:MAG: hypothetical protein J3Q66DRAFT_385032 [Benniella sp.]|nr:MAG: hypothetical protein J3Q66DRAFT_385032 [Benniella sp.]